MIGAAWAWIAGTKLGRLVGLVAGLALAFGVVFLRGRAEGRRKAREAIERATAKRVKEGADAASKARQHWRDAPGSDVDDELRERDL